MIKASNQRNKMNESGLRRSHTDVVKTSKAYFPVCTAHVDNASIHSSLEIPGLAGLRVGEGDFFRCILAGEGAVYCFRGETEMKTVFAAGLRLRVCERIDAVGLERPLLDFNGDGLGLIKSSHASSSDVVESSGILALRCSSLFVGSGGLATFLVLDIVAGGAKAIYNVYHAADGRPLYSRHGRWR
jgi:hypothetical protein